MGVWGCGDDGKGTPLGGRRVEFQRIPLIFFHGDLLLLLSPEFHLQQPSVVSHIVGARGRHDTWPRKSDRKQPEIRTEEKLAIRWSKHPGVYIKNFHLAKQVYERKTESGGHRGPQGIRACPRGVAAPCCLVSTLWVLSAVSYFCKFSNIPKLIERIFYGIFGVGLLTVSHTYPFSG
jgi:hypothetical protein